MRRKTTVVAVAAFMVLAAALAAGAAGAWSQAESIETFGAGAHPNFNSDSTEGCPFISPDGKRFFMMSTRGGEGAMGGQDIWVSTRNSPQEPWGEPVNVGAPINSGANDFCPTLSADGKTFFFASNRAVPGACGGSDLYTAQLDADSHATSVTNLGCEVNSSADEHSPFPGHIQGVGKVLLYSSARSAGAGDAPGDHDIYYSPLQNGAYGAGVYLEDVNTTDNEGQPNLSTNGNELFFWSNRPGSIMGSPDIYSSRLGSDGTWGTPQNLGPDVNSGAPDTRPSLSRNGKVLYFGSGRSGAGDIYVTSR